MHCEEAEALLGRLVFDELEPDEKEPLREHVESCAACRELAGDMRVAAKLLKEGVELEAPVLSPERKAVLARLDARLRRRERLDSHARRVLSGARKVLTSRRVGAAAAAVLVFAILAGLLLPAMKPARERAMRHRITDTIIPMEAAQPSPPGTTDAGDALRRAVSKTRRGAIATRRSSTLGEMRPPRPGGGDVREEFVARAGIEDAAARLRRMSEQEPGGPAAGTARPGGWYTWRGTAGGEKGVGFGEAPRGAFDEDDTELAFTAGDWSTPQPVVVTGVDRSDDDVKRVREEDRWAIFTPFYLSDKTRLSDGKEWKSEKKTPPGDDTLGPDVVAWWRLDDGAGLTALDSAGTNDGRLTNMTGTEWTIGKTGGALDFDGTDDHVDVGAGAAPGEARTVTAWVKVKPGQIAEALARDGSNDYSAWRWGPAVEARFIEATNSYLEDAGVDFEDIPDKVAAGEGTIHSVAVAPKSGRVTTEAGGVTRYDVFKDGKGGELRLPQTAQRTVIGKRLVQTPDGPKVVTVTPPGERTAPAAGDARPDGVYFGAVGARTLDGRFEYEFDAGRPGGAGEPDKGKVATWVKPEWHHGTVKPRSLPKDYKRGEGTISGVTVAPGSGRVTTEDGDVSTFTIPLDSQPRSDVKVTLQSEDTDGGVVTAARVAMANTRSNKDLLKFRPNVDWTDRWGGNFTDLYTRGPDAPPAPPKPEPVTPRGGAVAGGTEARISGSGFDPRKPPAVTFGGGKAFVDRNRTWGRVEEGAPAPASPRGEPVERITADRDKLVAHWKLQDGAGRDTAGQGHPAGPARTPPPPAPGAQPENLAGEVNLRIYDVRDLTEQITNFPGPELQVEVGGLESGKGAGLTLMGPDDVGGEEVTAESLAEMISARVRPDEWAAELGTSIEERSGKLVVMQRPEVHRLIDRLLKEKRAKAAAEASEQEETKKKDERNKLAYADWLAKGGDTGGDNYTFRVKDAASKIKINVNAGNRLGKTLDNLTRVVGKPPAKKAPALGELPVVGWVWGDRSGVKGPEAGRKTLATPPGPVPPAGDRPGARRSVRRGIGLGPAAAPAGGVGGAVRNGAIDDDLEKWAREQYHDLKKDGAPDRTVSGVSRVPEPGKVHQKLSSGSYVTVDEFKTKGPGTGSTPADGARPTSYAGRIVLKGGKSITGRVVEKDGTIEVTTPAGARIEIPRSKVAARKQAYISDYDISGAVHDPIIRWRDVGGKTGGETGWKIGGKTSGKEGETASRRAPGRRAGELLARGLEARVSHIGPVPDESADRKGGEVYAGRLPQPRKVDAFGKDGMHVIGAVTNYRPKGEPEGPDEAPAARGRRRMVAKDRETGIIAGLARQKLGELPESATDLSFSRETKVGTDEERAREAYRKAIAAAAKMRSPRTKIAGLERMRAVSGVAGTRYEKQIESEIKRHKAEMAKERAASRRPPAVGKGIGKGGWDERWRHVKKGGEAAAGEYDHWVTSTARTKGSKLAATDEAARLKPKPPERPPVRIITRYEAQPPSGTRAPATAKGGRRGRPVATQGRGSQEGFIDDVRVYDRGLTQREVRDVMKTQKDMDAAAGLSVRRQAGGQEDAVRETARELSRGEGTITRLIGGEDRAEGRSARESELRAAAKAMKEGQTALESYISAPRVHARAAETAEIEKLLKRASAAVGAGRYDDARAKLREVLEREPKAEEAWKLVRAADKKTAREMLTDPRMAEPKVLYELYKRRGKKDLGIREASPEEKARNAEELFANERAALVERMRAEAKKGKSHAGAGAARTQAEPGKGDAGDEDLMAFLHALRVKEGDEWSESARRKQIDRMHKIITTQQKALEVAKGKEEAAAGQRIRMEREPNQRPRGPSPRELAARKLLAGTQAELGGEGKPTRERLEQQMAMALVQHERGKFEEAEELASRILKVDPTDKDAKALLALSRQKRHDLAEEELYKRQGREGRKAWRVVEEAAIPYSERLRYPESWETIRRRVEAAGRDEASEAARRKQIDRMRKTITTKQKGLEVSEAGKEADAARSRHLKDAGKRLYDEMQYVKAREALQRAVVLDPSNKEAAENLAKVNDLLAVRMPSVRTALEELSREKKVSIQQSLVGLEKSLSRAKDSLERSQRRSEGGGAATGVREWADKIRNADRAVMHAERAREITKWMPSEIDTKEQRKRADKLLADARKRRAEALKEFRKKKRGQSLGRLERGTLEEQKLEEAKIAKLTDQVQKLFDDEDFDRAEKLAAEALELDPANAKARELWGASREQKYLKREAGLGKARKEEKLALDGKLAETGIPYSDLLVYPPDWKDISKRGGDVKLREDIAHLEEDLHNHRWMLDALKDRGVPVEDLTGEKLLSSTEQGDRFFQQRKGKQGKETLAEKKARLEKELHDRSWQIERLMAHGVPVREYLFSVAAQPEKPVHGKVLAVRPEVNLVMLSAGSDDNVKKGHRFTVYDGERYVGKVEVERVFSDMASARILTDRTTEAIREGYDASAGIGQGGRGEAPSVPAPVARKDDGIPERSPRWIAAHKLLGKKEGRREERPVPETDAERGRAIAGKLDRKISFEFVDTPLSEAIQFLQTLTETPITLDPEARASGGVRPASAPITLKVTKMPLRTALRWVLRLADMDYAVGDTGVLVSTPDRLGTAKPDRAPEKDEAREAKRREEVRRKAEEAARKREEAIRRRQEEARRIAEARRKEEEAKHKEEEAARLKAEEAAPPPPVNPFVLAARDRLSTFALDTDTASYTIARNYIRRNSLPPPVRIRMEEFVNAFDYNYPTQARDVFNIHIEGTEAPFGRGLHLLKIGVQAKVLGREGRKPAHLVFVVDTSGSMDRPRRLPLVKLALGMLLGELSERDRVSVVTYGTRARLVLEAVAASDRKRIHGTIASLQCGGSTNLHEGVRLGYEVARRHFRAGDINRVILCSDGVANVGASVAEDILAKAEMFRGWGVTLTTAGFGTGSYNDEMLERLANSGDGNYVFIDSEREARRVFVEEMSATLQTVAKDAKIQVEFDPRAVRRYRLIGYENRDIKDKQFRDDTVDAGEVGSGQSATALYEVEFVDRSRSAVVRSGSARAALTGAGDLGMVYVRYRNIDTGKVEEISKRLARDTLRRKTPKAAPRLYLAACAAEFAEVLRASEHARGAKLDTVERILVEVANALPLDGKVSELLSLVARAKGLRGER